MPKRLNVWTIRKGKDGERDFWKCIGTAFINRDGSLNVMLDALPLDGKLHIREPKEKDDTPESLL